MLVLQNQLTLGCPQFPSDGFSMSLSAPAVVGVFGNSFAAQNWNTYTATSNDRRPQGYATTLAFKMHQKVRASTAGNFGVSGEKLAAMLTRRATAIAYNPDIWILCDIFANDMADTGVTAATIKTNVATLLADFAATGKLVIVTNTIPRNSWSTLTAPEIDARVLVQNEVRAWLPSEVAKYSNCFLVDIWDSIKDPGSLTNGALSGYLYDGLHPSHWTGALYAEAMQTIIDSVCTFNFTGLPTISSAKNTNTNATGSSGTNGTGSSGAVQNNASIARVTGSNVVTVNSKETTTINGETYECQKMVISGAIIAGEDIRMTIENPETVLGFTGGTDQFCAIVPIKYEGAKGIQGIWLQNIIDMTTGTDPASNDMVAVSGQYVPDGADEGTLFTQALAVPAGTRTRDRCLLNIRVDGTISGNGVTLWVGKAKFGTP